MAKFSRSIQQRVFERDSYTCQGCKKKYPANWEVNVSEALSKKQGFLVVDHIDGRSDEEVNLQSLCWPCNSSKGGRNNYTFKLCTAIQNLGRPVIFYPSIKDIFGFKAAILLCDLIYWIPKGRHQRASQGWIYKSAEELKEETGLTYKEQYRARALLKQSGVLEEDYRREEHLLFIRINPEKLDALWDSLSTGQTVQCQQTSGQEAPDKTEGATGHFGSSYKSKSTSESTHKEAADAAVVIFAIEESQRTGENADAILKRLREGAAQ